MTYTLSLKSVGIITAIFLLLLNIPAIFQKNLACAWLKKFPRSKFWGLILLSLATLWTFLLIMKMDLGEFSRLRLPIMGFVILSAFLSWEFLDEFLSVRSLGVLAMLAAHPILNACFHQSPSWRLILVVLAYIWIICGLFWVGMPYLLRNQIAWICASPLRWNIITSIGIITGLVLLWYSCLGRV